MNAIFASSWTQEPTSAFAPRSDATRTGTDNILFLRDRPSIQPDLAPEFSDIDDLVTELTNDPAVAAEMPAAGQWLAETYYATEDNTLRTLRLRTGMSQQQLALRLGTSQSHVARMENGATNLNFETCQRLCAAFGIDMNALATALLATEQSALAASP